MKTIVIDPGHGGYDFGAINGTRFEKDDNLRLALAINDKLANQAGIRTILTRETDDFVSLADRAAISNYNKADLFISLHRNAFANPAVNGVENFVIPNPSQTTLHNAQIVLNEVANVGVQSNRGLKTDTFYVLKNTTAPAQLLEMGFITNEVDNNYFDNYFDSYATAIARGLMKALGLEYMPLPQDDDRKAVIRSIQTTLNSRYGTNLVVDGLYGPATRRALVIALQTELNRQYGANLVVDGIFGAATRANVRSLRRGDTGNLVYILQAALFANGYDVGALDGIFGNRTDEALLKYQIDSGLVPDRIAGGATFNSLLRQI